MVKIIYTFFLKQMPSQMTDEAIFYTDLLITYNTQTVVLMMVMKCLNFLYEI